jgi:hypothetical protein
MHKYPFHKLSLFVGILTTLSSCTIPKKIELTSINGFNQSHCAVIRSDAFFSLWDYYKSKKVQLHIFPPDEKIPEFINRADSERIPKGTHLKIDLIETMWDFENGNRITILGNVPFDSKELPFSFERFILPEADSYIEKIFTPC